MSLIRKHGAVLQAWACLALVLLDVLFRFMILQSFPEIFGIKV